MANIAINPSNINRVKLSIALLCQEGATSFRFSSSRVSNEFDLIVPVKLVQDLSQEHKITMRRLGPALRDQAVQVGEIFNVPGNLSRSY